MVSLLLLRLGLCILGHPSHAGHRVRSSARLPLSISLFGPVRPCVPLKTTSSIGPISVGLSLPKRKAGPFLRSAAAIPAGSLCAVLRGFGAYFSSPWAYPQQTAFRVSRSPCLSLSQPALFLGKRSIPCLWRCALCAASVFDSGHSLWAVPLQPPGRPSSRWEFPSMRSLRPKLSPSRGSMQISDLWILRFETHSHFRILAGFGIALCRLSGLGAIPLAVGGRRIRAYPFSSGVHRFLAPLRPCPLFLPLPAEILRFAFRKKQVYGKRVPVVFFVWFLGVLRRVSAGTAPEAAIFPLCLCRSIVGFFRSSGCCVLRVFRASAPALFAHPGLAGRVPISGFPLDRSCSQPRFFARPAACGFFAVRRLLRIAA